MHQIMTDQQKTARKPRPKSGKTVSGADVPTPEWADGLRNIYDSVVNEPLPPDMLALLASLDDDGDK